jgi:hypothetical protein
MPKAINLIKNNILSRNEFVSPLDGKKISKKQFIKETKYLKEVDTMFSTIEDNIFDYPDRTVEVESPILSDEDKYVQVYNNIIAAGVKDFA